MKGQELRVTTVHLSDPTLDWPCERHGQEQKRAFPFPCFLKMSAGQCFCYF